MQRMIRKQIYIDASQDRLLKQRADELGVTESDLIRRSIDQFTRLGAHPPTDPAAADRIIGLLDELDRRFADATPTESTPGRWTREEMYGERLRRFLD